MNTSSSGKRHIRIMLASAILILLTCAAFTAAAEYVATPPRSTSLTLYGAVAAGSTITVSSPMSGFVDSIYVSEGDTVTPSDILFEIHGADVVAPIDGVVRLAGAEVGLDATMLTSKYGAPLYIEPAQQFVVNADKTGAYSSEENKILHIGETVYLASRADDAITAEGYIASISGKNYTIVVTSGEIALDERVNVYRNVAHSSSQKIGQGVMARNAEVAVPASDTITALYVQQGSSVRRGDALMETAKIKGGAIDSPLTAPETAIVASVVDNTGESVVAGQALATLYPVSGLVVRAAATEQEAGAIAIGGTVELTYWNGAEKARATGTITSVSGLNTGTEEEPQYMVTIAYQDDKLCRLGMSVTVTIASGV